MADVKSDLNDWSVTAGSNKPTDSDIVGTGLDDNLRQIQATVRQYLAHKGSDMASAATLDLATADGYAIDVTVGGITVITSLGTLDAGRTFLLQFDGAVTLTHHATKLICPGGANIVTAAGDMCLVASLGSGNWRVGWYVRADGSPVKILDEDTLVSDSATFPASQQSIKAYNDKLKNNLIINGSFNVAQRGTSFTSATTPANSDDTYLLDRWVLLSDGNDIVDVTQQSGGGVDGNSNYIRLDVETASKKFGILQIIEGINCDSIIGSTASLSFDAKVTDATKLGDIRAVVVAWSSTEDTVTSDIISAWGAEGANPTLVANWTAENTAADLSVTTSWARYKIENISIDTASAANVAVFIYQNNVATNDTAGKFLEVTNVKLEPGANATPYEVVPIADTLARCLRYYQNIDTATMIIRGDATQATGGQFQWVPFSTEKRTTPTVALNNTTYSNGSTGLAGTPKKSGFEAYFTVTGANSYMVTGYEADAEL